MFFWSERSEVRYFFGQKDPNMKLLTNCSNQQKPLVAAFDSISGHYPLPIVTTLHPQLSPFHQNTGHLSPLVHGFHFKNKTTDQCRALSRNKLPHKNPHRGIPLIDFFDPH